MHFNNYKFPCKTITIEATKKLSHSLTGALENVPGIKMESDYSRYDNTNLFEPGWTHKISMNECQDCPNKNPDGYNKCKKIRRFRLLANANKDRFLGGEWRDPTSEASGVKASIIAKESLAAEH